MEEGRDALTATQLGRHAATAAAEDAVDMYDPLEEWGASLPVEEEGEGALRLEVRGGGGGVRRLRLPAVDSMARLGLGLQGNAPVRVDEVRPGMPAALAGVRAGDAVLAVDGQPCEGFSHSRVVRLLTGALTRACLVRDEALMRSGAMGMVVATTDAVGGVGVDGIDVALPGQAAARGGDDPLAPIRAAADRHQAEAARLMAAGKYAKARKVLDRAIVLLAKIPDAAPGPRRSRGGGGGAFRPLVPGAAVRPKKVAAGKRRTAHEAPLQPMSSHVLHRKQRFRPIKPAPRTKAPKRAPQLPNPLNFSRAAAAGAGGVGSWRGEGSKARAAW